MEQDLNSGQRPESHLDVANPLVGQEIKAETPPRTISTTVSSAPILDGKTGFYMDDLDSNIRTVKLTFERFFGAKMSTLHITPEMSPDDIVKKIREAQPDFIVSDFNINLSVPNSEVNGLDILIRLKSEELNIPMGIYSGDVRNQEAITSVNWKLGLVGVGEEIAYVGKPAASEVFDSLFRQWFPPAPPVS